MRVKILLKYGILILACMGITSCGSANKATEELKSNLQEMNKPNRKLSEQARSFYKNTVAGKLIEASFKVSGKVAVVKDEINLKLVEDAFQEILDDILYHQSQTKSPHRDDLLNIKSDINQVRVRLYESEDFLVIPRCEESELSISTRLYKVLFNLFSNGNPNGAPSDSALELYLPFNLNEGDFQTIRFIIDESEIQSYLGLDSISDSMSELSSDILSRLYFVIAHELQHLCPKQALQLRRISIRKK